MEFECGGELNQSSSLHIPFISILRVSPVKTISLHFDIIKRDSVSDRRGFSTFNCFKITCNGDCDFFWKNYE